jgi:hypothetical protein
MGMRSKTRKAGLSYAGNIRHDGSDLNNLFVPKDQYTPSPEALKIAADAGEALIRVSRERGLPINNGRKETEAFRNQASQAAEYGDFDTASRLADIAKYHQVQRQIWGDYKPNKMATRPEGGVKGKPQGGKKSTAKGGDGYQEPKEHNPFKRALGMVLGAPGVQQALKAVRMPYSYVASHVSDLAQEVEQGDIGGAIGALGRGVGLGAFGEVADAVQGKGFDVAGILNSYENEKNRKDFWKQTGVGEYLQRGLDKHTWDDGTILNNKWFKRGVGAAGDIGLDPLTYLTAATTKLAGSGAQVATRVTEAGSELAAREGAAAAAKAAASGLDQDFVLAAKRAAEEDAMQYIKDTAANVIKHGKRTMKKADVARIFPEEKIAGGLAVRVPFTGRPTRSIVKGLTGGKVEIEEKLIPLLSKDITNPVQRVLSKPARALGASKFANKMSGKFAGELGQELRKLIRSGDPETVYKGLGIKRALNVMRSRAASSLRVSPQTLSELFPESAGKLVVSQGDNAVGPTLAKLWMNDVAPAIKGREAEIIAAVEAGTPEAVQGAEKVVAFYKAAHRSMGEAGIPVGKIAEGQYIPRQFTEEGRQALREVTGDVPKGTVAVDPKAAFQKHRALLEEMGVSNQDEARQMLEGLYGRNLKGGKVFETDIHKIAANYIRQADQQLGRRAMLQELKGWGIALEDGEIGKYFRMADQETPKVAANRLVNQVGKKLPLSEKRKLQRVAQQVFEGMDSGEAAAAEDIAQQVDDGLRSRLRTPAEAPITPEEQLSMDALMEGVTGEPIPASEVINPNPDAVPESALTPEVANFDKTTLGGPALVDYRKDPLLTQMADDIQNDIFAVHDERRLIQQVRQRYGIGNTRARNLLENSGLIQKPTIGRGVGGPRAGDNLLGGVLGPRRNPTMFYAPDTGVGSLDSGLTDPMVAYADRVQAARERLAAWKGSVNTAKERIAQLKNGANQDIYGTLEFFGYQGSLDDPVGMIEHLQGTRDALLESGTRAEQYAAKRLQEHIDTLIQYPQAGFRPDIATAEGGSFVQQVIPDNPTMGDLNSLKEGLDDAINATAEKFVPNSAYEASLMADPEEGMRIIQAKQAYASGIANHLRNAVSDAATSNIVRSVDKATGEILVGGTESIEATLDTLRNSPHWPEIEKQLEALGAAERRIIAESDRPLEGLGRYGDLTSDAKFNPDDTTTWGENYDVKAAEAEGDLSGLTHDEITGRIRKARRRIREQNELLRSAPHSEKDVIRRRLAQLQDELDALDTELWREGGPSSVPANKGREAGVTDALTGQVGDSFDAPAFFGRETALHRQSFNPEDLVTLQAQRNLGDVYLGVQRMLEDADRAGVELGQRTYAEMDQLAGVTDTLFKQRIEMGSQHFNMPNSDTLNALEQRFAGNSDALEAAVLDQSGAFVKNFYTTQQEAIAARIEETLTAFEKNGQQIVGGIPNAAAPTAIDFDPVRRLSSLQRQRAELHAALYSGDSNEMIRVMLQHSIEGVGGDELSGLVARQLDDFTGAIRSGDMDAFDSAIGRMELPAHPMGEGQLTGAARPRPEIPEVGSYVDPTRESILQQQRWDTKNGAITQRAKQLQRNAEARGGVWHSNEIDELRSLKAQKEALGPRPRAQAAEAYAREAADADRLIRRYDETARVVDEMRDARRVVVRGNKVVGLDPEAQATLDNLRALEKSDAFGRSKRAPWEIGGTARGQVHELSFQEADAILIREVKPLEEARRKITQRYGTSKTSAYDAVDKAEAERLQSEINKINNERKALKKDYKQSGAKQAPADIGAKSSPEYFDGAERGRKLAEVRIREGKIDETISTIERRLAGSEKLSNADRGMLEGGLERLREHKAAMDKTVEEVAAKAATKVGPTLEISTRSTVPLGKDLSAFNLRITTPEGVETSVESAYHGAKIWTAADGTQIGPHPEWAELSPAAAKRAAKGVKGKFAGFEHAGKTWPADYTSDFYDVLYRQGFDAYAAQNPSAIDELMQYGGFTDSMAAKGSVAKQNETLQRIVDELRGTPKPKGTSAGGGMPMGDRYPFGPRRGIYMAPADDLGGGYNPVRGATGGAEGGQDALNHVASSSEPQAAVDGVEGAVSGQADDDLLASIDEVHDDPATPPRKRKILRTARDWVKNKRTRVASANAAAAGDATAEAAIGIQSGAENSGIMRYMRYPTSDPRATFQSLNNLDSLDDLAKMADENLNNMAWLQKNQGYVTDRQTAEILNQVATVNTPEGIKNFLGYYDKFMSYIKAWQLTTPGFHARNLMGGIFNNYLAGVEVGSTSRFMRNIAKFKAGKLTGEEAEWMKVIYETAGSGQYSHHEIGVASNVKGNWNPLSPRYKLLAGSARFGGDVEFRLRGALMWDRLSKGKGLQEALDDVTRYHFDYANLSNFETGVVKRIVPFYVWTRYNFPLQLEMMAQAPSKYRFYQQFKHSMEGREDKGVPVPSFLKNEMFGVPLPTHIGGGQNFLTLDLPFTRTMAGAMPDVENWNPKKLGTYPTLLDPYFSQMAVPIKTPAEMALSRQFFKGIPLRDTSKSEGYALGRVGPIANALGGKTKADYLTEQLMPAYGQLRRLIPTEKKNRNRLGTNWASYVGIPVRTNTKQDQENELARRRYLR